MLRDLLDRFAPLLGLAFALILPACIALGKWIERRRDPELYKYRSPPGIVGLLIFTALMWGIPIVIVIWGYATGRLPAR